MLISFSKGARLGIGIRGDVKIMVAFSTWKSSPTCKPSYAGLNTEQFWYVPVRVFNFEYTLASSS